MRRWMMDLSLTALIGLTAASCASQETLAPLDEGDVVYSGVGSTEKASNLERFEAFLAVTESGGDDAVRLVSMTTEDDPVYTDLVYKEGKYTVFVDASEDRFAEEKDRKRKKAAECKKLNASERTDHYREYSCGTFSFLIRGEPSFQ